MLDGAPKVETMQEARWRKQVVRWRDVQHRLYDGIPTEELREAANWETAAAYVARGGLETAARLAQMLAVALVVIDRMENDEDGDG